MCWIEYIHKSTNTRAQCLGGVSHGKIYFLLQKVLSQNESSFNIPQAEKKW